MDSGERTEERSCVFVMLRCDFGHPAGNIDGRRRTHKGLDSQQGTAGSQTRDNGCVGPSAIGQLLLASPDRSGKLAGPEGAEDSENETKT